MSTETAHTLISVRGAAQRTVAPDSVTLHLEVYAVAASAAEAYSSAATSLAGLLDQLAGFGGQALSVATIRAALTWSTRSISTHEEWNHDDGKRRSGQHRASAELTIAVRDFGLLDQVGAALARSDRANLHSVAWSVDDDNAEWALVRADAIHAALLKNRDYATALGGSVVRVEHVADAGLLGGEPGNGGRREMAFRASAQSAGDNSISLDPVPQVLHATIDARLTATAGPLPS